MDEVRRGVVELTGGVVLVVVAAAVPGFTQRKVYSLLTNMTGFNFEEGWNKMKRKAPKYELTSERGSEWNGRRDARDVILSIEPNYPWLISRLPRDHLVLLSLSR